MNLLLIKTSSLGDVIHMLPAVTDASQAVPGLKIDWLVEESFAAIPTWHPAVQKVIPIAMRRWKKNLTGRSTWQEIAAVREALQATAYDLVLDSQGLVKSAMWALLTKGPSAGYDHQSIREPLASLFYGQRLKVSRQQHAIERNRQLTALALGYQVPTSGPDYGLKGLFERLPKPEIETPANCVLGLHGTSRADKLWPVQGWIALAEALATIGRTLVLPWGNDEEHQRAMLIASHGPNVQVLPRLNLNALASIISQAEAVVGVDTGLLHLAAALSKPGLALYTATPPALTGAVSNCHAPKALQNLSTNAELTPKAVTQSILNILTRQPGAL